MSVTVLVAPVGLTVIAYGTPGTSGAVDCTVAVRTAPIAQSTTVLVLSRQVRVTGRLVVVPAARSTTSVVSTRRTASLKLTSAAPVGELGAVMVAVGAVVSRTIV